MLDGMDATTIFQSEPDVSYSVSMRGRGDVDEEVIGEICLSS